MNELLNDDIELLPAKAGVTGDRPKTCIVISYWIGHSIKTLNGLLKGMARKPSGTSYDIVIVCNGGGLSPQNLPKLEYPGAVTIVNRANQGYNIGAWDAGFQAFPDYQYYMFLQSECFIKRKNWLEAFIFRLENDDGVGILGEAIMWSDISWNYVKLATARDLGPNWFSPEIENPIDFYLSELSRMNIPSGRVGTHIQSLIMFLAGNTLREIGGFPSDSRYQHAVACEIAISRKVAALDRRVALVRPVEPFFYIGHSEWSWFGQTMLRMRRTVIDCLRPFVSSLKKLIRRGQH